MGPILIGPLADILTVRRLAGGNGGKYRGGGGGVLALKLKKVVAPGGDARVRMR